MTLADRIVVMRDGHIEQVGTPLEVFDRPSNAFVGSFIGSPPMNQIPGIADGGDVLLADGTRLRLPSRHSGIVNDGQEVIFGIRADDLTPAGHGIQEATETDEIELQVELAEPLGTETLIYSKLASQEVQGKMYNPRPVAIGEKLNFRISLGKAHLFDAGTGMAIGNG